MIDFPDLSAFTEETEEGISFFTEDVEMPLIEGDLAKTWLNEIAENETAKIGELNYIFCSDEYLLEVNRTYLQHDYYTDVITFPYSGELISGDIFISTERVLENAQKLGCTFAEELHRVLAHGLLHLIGYDDKTAAKKQEMSAKEDFYLSKKATV